MATGAALRRTVAARKDPRFTGSNRCLPCTAVDVALAATISLVLWLALGGSSTLVSAVAAAVTFASAITVIYLRGRLAPGTSGLLRRHFTVTRRFPADLPRDAGCLDDSERADDTDSPDDDPLSATEPQTATDPLAVLRELGIVEETPDGKDLQLRPAFASAWLESVDESAASTEELRVQLAAVAGLDPASVEVERGADSFDARYDGELIARWESKPACQADVAGAAIAPQFDPGWEDRPFATRTLFLGVLRLFLEVCPTCRGRVAISPEVVQSSYGSDDVVAATCRGCSARLFELAVGSSASTSRRGSP